MATRLIFLCASATASSRSGGFPAPDEPLDDGGMRKSAAYRRPWPLPDLVFASPSRAAIDTARTIGFDATIEPLLADLDYGDWSGCALGDVDPSALTVWLADPTAATPGGEAMAELVTRVGAWIDGQARCDRTLLVISHAAVVRAAIAHALAIPVASVMAFDIMPLGSARLSFHQRWRFQELGGADG